ncbi:hypothetical protein HGRIS_010091 [Hohenbuehelia grisea]|uniref:Fungal-type protein kinase domain-containing protein n=1 Tax=Hohenbuehelia grisea TaxID=104357 RepID=A0ABR3J375_9AGAR
MNIGVPVRRMLNPLNPLNPFDWKEDVSPVGTQMLGVPTLPDSFMIKCSHQRKDCISEVDVFLAAQGFIGVPRIITQYEPAAFEIPESKCPVLWKLHDELTEGLPSYKPRVHRHLIFESEGVRLSPRLTFRQVGYAMVHAMIGHCALFTEGKILHHDVSHENIIFLTGLSRSDRKIPSILSNVVSRNDCSAVLIDGDVAKKWRDNCPNSSDRSGTLPFLSRALTTTWVVRGSVLHTPIDDLESFILVLYYNALSWTSADQRTANEIVDWGCLNKQDLLTLSSVKQSIFLTWKDEAVESNLIVSDTVFGFYPLISAWTKEIHPIVQTAERFVRANQAPNEFEQLLEDAYVKMIRVGLDAAAKLADVVIDPDFTDV